MKRSLMAALIFAPLVLLFQSVSLAQSSDLLVLSKNFGGRIIPPSLSLPLTSNTDCDQTQSLIPDGSRLISDSFNLNNYSAGLGTFSGPARIVAPDGRVVLQGWLRGTVGVNTRRNPNDKDCRAPGRLEGIFEGAPARSIKRSTDAAKSQVIMLNFTAELNPLIAAPIPVYRGWLDGLITAPSPVEEKVKIAPDKAGYLPTDVITAIIFNGSDQTIQSLDQHSYCTIVQLQMWEDGRWIETAVCPLDRAPRPTNIFPNQKIEVALNRIQPTPALNPPGLYRLGLTFRIVENGNPVGRSLFVASEPFRIIAPPSSDRVSVTTDKSEYEVGETIVGKVANGNDQTIVTWDHQSNCTIVTVEKQEASGWVPVAPCPLLSPVLPVKIGPRMEVLVKLLAGSFNNRFEPGTYRLRFLWQFIGDNGQPAGNIMTTYSPQFTITSKR
jgi:hypothetical protein